jgi:hypothetical protein
MEKQKGLLWLRLDEPSRTRLLSICSPRFKTIFCDHVTLRFGIVLTAEYQQLIGSQHTVHAYEHCWNDTIQAVRVITHGLPDQYGVPHVTISAAEGIEPFLSVEMLHGQHHQYEPLNSIPLTGTVEFVV